MAFPFSKEPPFAHHSPPPPIPTSNFFSLQAIKYGYSGMEALQRELEEERIKEEIVASRIARRRMVEEEVKREHELMVMGKRFQEPMVERFGPNVGRINEFAEWFGPNVIRRNEFEERFGPNVVRRNEFGERVGPNVDRRNVEFEERWNFGGGSSGEVGRRVSPVPMRSDVKMVNEVNSPNQKLSGIKRKKSETFSGINTTRFPQPLQKDWSCALCQVSATCEDGLNAHLKGKKHQAMVAQLSSDSKPTVAATKSSSSTTIVAAQKNKGKNRAGKGKGKFSMIVKGKMYEVVECAGRFWCSLCSIQCTSKLNMAKHLVGKKHVLEESRTSKKPVEEVPIQAEEEEEVQMEAVKEMSSCTDEVIGEEL